MSLMYTLSCKKCDYKLDLMLGGGMFYPIEVTRENQYEYDEDFTEFFNEHPDGKVVLNENYLARCLECGEYEVVGDWTMHFAEEKIPFQNKCTHCGNELEIILGEDDIQSWCDSSFKIVAFIKFFIFMGGFLSLNSVKKTKIQTTCPKCHGKLVIKWTGMWD